MKCPRCDGDISRPAAGTDSVRCPGCQAILRLKPKPAAFAVVPERPADPTPAVARPKKRRKRKSAARSSAPPWLAGAAVLGLIVLVGGLAIWRGGRGGGGAGDGAVEIAAESGDPVEAFEPVPWAVDPAPPPAMPRLPNVVRLPDIYPERFALYPTDPPSYTGVTSRQDAFLFGRIDAATGLPVGPATTIQAVNGGPPLAAVSRAGALAVWNHREPSRAVRVWPPAGPPVDINMPALQFPLVDWLGWGADGTLVVLSNGKLSGWDMAGQRRYEVDGPANQPVALDPAGRWLAVSRAGKHLDALDTATGRCLGRVGGEGGWAWLGMSPDGKRLIGSRGAGGMQPAPMLELHVWDAATGERQAVIAHWPLAGSDSGGGVQWDGPDTAVYGHRNALKVFDLKTGLLRAVVTPPRGFYGLTASPDGRHWGFTDALRPVPLPAPPTGELAFGPCSAVRVEARTGDTDRDKQYQRLLEAVLAREGFRIGGGGWAVRLTAAATDGGFLEGSQLGSGVRTPTIEGKTELLDPSGAVVGTGDLMRTTYLSLNSKYKRQAGPGRDQGGVPGMMVKYDFGGRNPAAAMAEETWADFAKRLRYTNAPRGAWRTADGKHLPLPLSLDAK